ncbi:MAG TPA: Gldg family protein [Methylophilaceae bacterium]|nr:Gldg family protein [Methylophilaceae bacterium]
MKINRKLRFQLFAQNWLFLILFLALIALLAYASKRFHAEYDVTHAARNLLTAGSTNVVKQMKGAVNITAFVENDDADRKKNIHDFIARYQRAKSDINLAFVNTSKEPKRPQEAGVSKDGEIVVEYEKRSEHLAPPYAERDLTNLLVRLARSQTRAIMFLDGHGERSLIGEKNHDLGEFGHQLGKKGFKLANPDLTVAQGVPRSGAMLVIAGPQVDVSPAEVDKIMGYVHSGGNLLWLIDQESLHGLQPLAEYLGLVLTPGIAVDPTSSSNWLDPRTVVGRQYTEHPITKDFSLLTAFPESRQIEVKDASGDWEVTRLISVAQNGWLETGKPEAKIEFDAKRDIPGPVNIAVAMQRKAENVTQRVVVIGNGSFLANAFVASGGNLDLGINIVNWLAGDDKLITIQPKPLKDVNVSLSPTQGTLIFGGFVLVLPLAFLVIGIAIWRRRRTR